MDQSHEQMPLRAPLIGGHNYDLPIAIRGPIDHAAAWETSRALCRSFSTMHPQAAAMVDPLHVLQALNEAKVWLNATTSSSIATGCDSWAKAFLLKAASKCQKWSTTCWPAAG
ncbi:MAG TPA: hypothetical protein VF278_22980 [Pirellulales bacterium]